MQGPIVLTGFEPFGPHGFNPSGSFAAAAAASLAARGVDARSLLLPVTWATAASAPREIGPPGALLIHCGLAADRIRINLERGATNLAGSTPDNDGVRLQGTLEDGAPERLSSSLDLDALESALANALETSYAGTLTPTLGACQSDDAGLYICNAIYYRALQSRQNRALFVHIPALSRADAARAGRAFADALASSLLSGHNADT